MLHPSEVRIPLGRHSKLPSHVVVLAEPIRVVERRIRKHVIGAEVGMLDVAERVGMFLADVGLDASDGEVHDRKTPRGGVALLAVDADVPKLATVGLDELLRLHKHPARSTSRVIDPTLVRSKHFNEQPHDT